MTHGLLEAVDALTKEQHHKVIQQLDAAPPWKDGTQKVTRITQPSLLGQLDEAISSSMGGSTPGARLASESSVLNVTALYEAIKIAELVKDWCKLAGITPTKDTADNLRKWYVTTLSDGDEHAWHLDYLRRWAGTIINLLDPPRQKDLPDECPVCGANEWWDKTNGQRYGRPLVIRYRDDAPDKAKAMCRACEQVWNARELAYALEQNDTPKEGTTVA